MIRLLAQWQRPAAGALRVKEPRQVVTGLSGGESQLLADNCVNLFCCWSGFRLRMAQSGIEGLMSQVRAQELHERRRIIQQSLTGRRIDD